MRIHKVKGVSLLTALIFAFVLMVILSALAYNYRVSSLAIDTLTDDMENINLDEGYLDIVLNNPDIFDQTVDDTVGDSRFVTTSNSITPAFYHKNAPASLYYGEPLALSYNMSHQYFNNGALDYVKSFIMNELVNDTFTQYDQDIIPLNVPSVNARGMTGDLAAYKLSSGSSLVEDLEMGYIGYILQSSDILNIHANGTSSSVTVPSDLSLARNRMYKFSVGWNLVGGSWHIFLAAYDASKTYTSSTTLRNLIDNPSQAQTDLTNWQAVANLSPKKADGSTILSAWYPDSAIDVPKPLIVRTKGPNADIYITTYNSATKIFTATLADSFKIKKLEAWQIYI